MMYEICPLCGATLDFGEKCGCEEEKRKEPFRDSENGSYQKAISKKLRLNYIMKPEKSQAPEEKYNAEKAVEAQRALCDKYGLTNFAPAFDGTCFYCGRNIYEPYSEGGKKPTGYTVEEAGRKHIFICPHCHKDFLD